MWISTDGNLIGSKISSDTNGDISISYGPTNLSLSSLGAGTGGLQLDGTSGYIDIFTNSNYINDLKSNKFAIVFIAQPNSDISNSARYLSSETATNTGLRMTKSGSNEANITWDGDTDLNELFELNTQLHNIVLTFNNNQTSICVDGEELKTSAFDNLQDIDMKKIRLGASLADTDNFASCKYGSFFILDLSNVSINNQTLASTINKSCTNNEYDGESIAKDIVDYNSNISGSFFTFDKNSSSQDINNEYFVGYDLETQEQNENIYAITSDSGVTTTLLSSETGISKNVAGRQIQIKYEDLSYYPATEADFSGFPGIMYCSFTNESVIQRNQINFGGTYTSISMHADNSLGYYYAFEVITNSNSHNTDSEFKNQYFTMDGNRYLKRRINTKYYWTLFNTGDIPTPNSKTIIRGTPMALGSDNELILKQSSYDLNEIQEYAEIRISGSPITVGRIGGKWYLIINLF